MRRLVRANETVDGSTNQHSIDRKSLIPSALLALTESRFPDRMKMRSRLEGWMEWMKKEIL